MTMDRTDTTYVPTTLQYSQLPNYRPISTLSPPGGIAVTPCGDPINAFKKLGGGNGRRASATPPPLPIACTKNIGSVKYLGNGGEEDEG